MWRKQYLTLYIILRLVIAEIYKHKLNYCYYNHVSIKQVVHQIKKTSFLFQPMLLHCRSHNDPFHILQQVHDGKSVRGLTAG